MTDYDAEGHDATASEHAMTRRMFDIDKLLHPQDHRAFQAEAARLQKAGLDERQIATALRLSPTAARELLAEPMPRSQPSNSNSRWRVGAGDRPRVSLEP